MIKVHNLCSIPSRWSAYMKWTWLQHVNFHYIYSKRVIRLLLNVNKDTNAIYVNKKL